MVGKNSVIEKKIFNLSNCRCQVHFAMPKNVTVLHIFRDAPTKPASCSPCNGCGVCCLIAPCPLGVLLSCRRLGACQALIWQAEDRRYVCGAITSVHDVLTRRLPLYAHALLPVLCSLLRRLAKRWVAEGVGCDCDVEIDTVTQDG